jgi:hypothetical protein
MSGGHSISANTNSNYNIVMASTISGSLPFVGTLRVWNGLIGQGTAGPIYTDTIRTVGDLIYQAPAGSVQPGIWSLEFLSVVDANGCSADLSNSRYNFTFYVSDPNVVTVNAEVCAPNGYNFNGLVLFNGGTFLDTLTSSLGVDSFVTLNLTVNQPSSTSLNQVICSPDSYVFNGQVITTSGVYTATLVNAVGCDSVITLDITFNPRPVFSVELNGISYSSQQGGYTLGACTNSSYAFTFGALQTGSLPLIGQLRVWDGGIGSGVPSQPFTDTIYSIGDLIYAAPIGSVNAGIWGVEFLSVVDANGCSADLSGGAMNFTFNVSEPSSSTINASICSPLTYPFNGQDLSASGTYLATFTNAGGCDSVVTLNLFVGTPSPTTTLVDTICAPSTIIIGGQTFGTTGTYVVTLTNSTGCDSVIILNLVATSGVTEIVTQPSSVYAEQGSVVNMAIGVAHEIAIQWQSSADGLTWSDISNGSTYSGVYSASLSINASPALSGRRYRAVVLGCQGHIISQSATLTLYPSASPVGLSIGNVSGCPGEEIVVPVLVSNFSNVGRIQLDFGYDASLLQLLSFQPNASITGVQVVPAAGVVSIRRNLTIPASLNNDTLMKLTFVALGSGQSALQWLVSDPGVLGLGTGNPDNMVHRLTYQNGSVVLGGITPVISQQPSNTTVLDGASTTLTVVANNAASFQWQTLTNSGWTDLSNQGPYQGVQTAQLSVNPVSGALHNRRFRVLVTGVCPPSVPSDEAILTVIPGTAPVVLSLENRTVCSAGTLGLSVSATDFIGINAMDLSISYNPASMVFTGISAAHPSLPGIIANVNASGVISISWFGLVPSNLGAGELFKLDFVVNTGAAVTWNASSNGAISLVNQFGQNLPVQLVNGGVTVRGNSLQITPLGNVCINALPVNLSANISGGVFSGAGVSGGVFNPAVAGLGTNAISYTVTDSFGCTNTASVFVTVIPAPTSTGGGNVTVCPGTSTSLTAAGTGIVSYLWSTGETTQSIAVQPSLDAVYWVILTNSAGCSVTDTFRVNVFAVSVVSAGADQAICQGASTQLTATGAAQYVWSTLGAVQPFAFTANPFVSPNTTTSYVVQGVTLNGCITQDTIVVTVNPRPNVSVSDSVLTFCNSGPGAQLEALGGVSYLWSPATGLDNPNISTPVATPSTTTLYSVTITNANGCSDVRTVLVIVPSVFAGSNRTICSGSSTQLNAVYNGTALSYQWTPSTGLSNAFIANPVAMPSSSIIYTVRVNDATGCQVSSQVRVIVNSSPNVNAGADVSIAPSASTTLNGFVSNATSFLWSPSTGLSSATIPNPIATPSVTTAYVLTATGSNGCVRMDTVVVTVDPNLSGGTISGRVVYDRLGNAVRTPVTSGTVHLTGNSAATSGILSGGSYAFPGLTNGGYQVNASISMPAGGITTADAFLINNYLGNPNALSGLAILAADANGDGIVNSADALLVLQRSINLPTAIFATPWVSENASITVSNSNPVRDISVLSRGDVNRDYSFSSRLVRGIQIEAGAHIASSKQIHTLPIVATRETILGSFQMHVEVANGLRVKRIIMSQTGERVLFNQSGNQLYLGWYTSGGAYVAAEGSALFEVEFEQDIRGIQDVMSVVGFSQATDYEATPLAMLRVQVPVYSVSALVLDVLNFPNPFSTSTEITYQLPEDGSVQFTITDYSGKTIFQSEKLLMPSGKHSTNWSAGDVADGVYMLHVRFDGQAGTQTKSTKLMIRR